MADTLDAARGPLVGQMPLGTPVGQVVPEALEAQDGAEETFGGLLRRLRLDRGLTQEALAERAGVSPRGIQLLERGVSRPQRETARRLIQALGLSDSQRLWLEALVAPAPRRRARDLPRGAGVPEPAAVPADVPAARGTLPAPVTTFIGREHEVAEVVALLARARLVTLTGPGGTGKTRLALEVARRVRDGGAYPDGVWFVDLSPVRDPALVSRAVAHALGVAEEGRRALGQTLVDVLGARRVLLVVDNCEHLLVGQPGASMGLEKETGHLEGVTLLSGLLAACPGLAILATSRVVLHLAGEHDYPVEPLPVPPAGEAAPEGGGGPEEGQAAVRLFVERAKAAWPGFALTEENAGAVAGICRAVDGLPLAIELAAARTRLLPPAALLAQLSQGQGQGRLSVLAGGTRDAPARHQTLRATLDASVDLLSEGERALLRRLAVFDGGWTLEAAEVVCAGDGAGTRGVGGMRGLDAPGRVLDGLAVLVDHSLVRVRVAGGEPRFDMLETIRAYALEQAGAAQETGRTRHAAYFAALAERAGPELHGPRQGSWMDRLEEEHDNLRAALRWLLADGSPAAIERGVRVCLALEWFWWPRAYFSEALAWLRRLLDGSDTPPEPPETAEGAAVVGGEELPPALRSLAVGMLSRFESYRGRAGRGKALAQASLAMARASGDPPATAQALLRVGSVLVMEDPPTSRSAFEESAAISRSLGDEHGLALALDEGAAMMRYQDSAEARRWLEESVAISRRLGDARGIASALWKLGSLHTLAGEHDAAFRVLEEGMALYTQVRARMGMVVTSDHLERAAIAAQDWARAGRYNEQAEAFVRAVAAPQQVARAVRQRAGYARRLGDHARARALAAESLRLFHATGAPGALGEPLLELAQLAALDGHLERAARLLGAAEAQLAVAPPVIGRMREADLAAARAEVRAALEGETRAARWMAEGAALDEPGLVSYALEAPPSLAMTAAPVDAP